MKPFIVAEIGANHLGSLDRALRLVDAAYRAGADAIKLQTFTPEQMAEAGTLIESGPWAGRELLDLYEETHTPRPWHRIIFDFAKSLGLTPFSSVFHPDDVDFLETLDCPIYKIASFELTDLKLIAHAARTGKPLIMSIGMAVEDEVGNALRSAHGAGCRDITVLKCTSAYPAPTSDANLLTINDLQTWLSATAKHHPEDWTKWSVGFSDHTLGSTCAIVATALGATVIEKHLTLRRSDGGPDAAFSAEPEEFAAMVKGCHEAAAALGVVHFGPTASEASSLPFRRSPGGKRGGK